MECAAAVRTPHASHVPAKAHISLPGGGNYTANSTFQANLHRVLSSISDNAPNDSGYYYDTAGTNPDKTDGGLQCIGDFRNCNRCARAATKEITVQCPYNKESAIFYDDCWLRYSNENLSSLIQVEDPTIYFSNTLNVKNPDQFTSVLLELMNRLLVQAALNDPNFFSTGETNSNSETIYARVQCTQDNISRSDCSSCLRSAVFSLSICCYRTKGGTVIKPSCDIRYQTYRFYQSEAIPPSRSSAPPRGISPSNTNSTRAGYLGIKEMLIDCYRTNNSYTFAGQETRSTTTVVAVVVSTVIAAILLTIILIYFYRRRRKATKKKVDGNAKDMEEMGSVESFQFNLKTIQDATNNFCEADKLGEGGFSIVYKGILSDGQEIAVKRLSKNSGQGIEEFKNEVQLVVKLQHRNLVKLLGFCLEGDEKLLIYEFAANKSLDHFLFDPIKCTLLDWERRYNIIGGIARGLLYLHEDSRHKIIHRDLKAGNILLDVQMEPKISDFGMARLFGVDQTEGETCKVVGTYGYMAPEFAMRGKFSVKSDVFSYGVLTLELISGQQNKCFFKSDHSEDLIRYAWRHWEAGTSLELIDPTLKEQYSSSQVIRCIHIGLLCVQEDVDLRPTMTTVVHMLNRDSISLPVPSRPGFFINSREMNIGEKHTAEENQSLLSDQSMSSISNNELSMTALYPR
ncbi:hypothetical protein AQUCO_00500432v1 [Aquilegia coerulea]|uniref:Uncharacterized protein n=1 Tax=Aquilegia coerulea TaxID=218851 RepID=A0A2G5ERW9_AQUCA|nr:hypothetical protein AQUCO_00500432v1 [Aquilegia coerulea]